MRRREVLDFLGKISFGVLLFGGTYANAISYLDKLGLTTTPDSQQRKMIDSNIEFQLAAECGIIGDTDECRVKYCNAPAAKAKCHTYGDF